ncbi:MAG: VWA domain-containing protein, partial [Planctomycetaceae bacterium]
MPMPRTTAPNGKPIAAFAFTGYWLPVTIFSARFCMVLATAYTFSFAQPLWLAVGSLAVPMAYFAWKNLATLGAGRRVAAVALRVLVVLVLAAAMARPAMVQHNDALTLITVVDRSLSIPADQQAKGRNYVAAALKNHDSDDRLAVIDVADGAMIARLPGKIADATTAINERNTSLGGTQTRLSAGLQLGLAIAPPDTAVRMLLVSDGNETAGDVRETARIAAANGIPVDVLRLGYDYSNEVVFRNLVAPVRARSGQTIPLRFVLSSVGRTTGTINLTLRDDSGTEHEININPGGAGSGMPVTLVKGTNVFSVSVPVGVRGMHEFKARFTPAGDDQDSLPQNNSASAITFVAGPGHVIVADTDDKAGEKIAQAMKVAGIDVRRCNAHDFPDRLVDLMACDAVVLANVDCASLSMEQQEMLARYVTELGGGLVMTGGDSSFGAGGWIGSPVAQVLPVDLDPPQKKQMPKGALVLVIDHSGSMTGQKVECAKAAAAAAVRLLSTRDYLGVIAFDSEYSWVIPMAELTDKDAVYRKISDIGAGGGTDIFPALKAAYEAVKKTKAGVRHIILLTDGQSAGADCRSLAAQMGKDKITVSTVAIGDDADLNLLAAIAKSTGGRFYPVQNLKNLPQIFIKEAQIVRRSLIVEEKFTPKITFGASEIVRGVPEIPALDGYILTGRKGGTSQVILATPTADADPVLA